jgi:hypothetical protein
MIRWNVFFKVEKVEQLALIAVWRPIMTVPVAESFRKTES